MVIYEKKTMESDPQNTDSSYKSIRTIYFLVNYCTGNGYKQVFKTFNKNVERCRDGCAKNHKN